MASGASLERNLTGIDRSNAGQGAPKRNAEKDRPTSTCQLADLIVQASLQAYHTVCPLELREAYQQTVLATIVLQETQGGDNRLQVVALAVGTKVLAADLIHSSDEAKENRDLALHDMHAEVLARRCFKRVLLEHMQYLLRCPHGASPLLDYNAVPGLYEIKPSIKLHLYSSSQPCGNACIKRWAKSKRAVVAQGIGMFDLPPLAHPPFFPTAIPEGETAVLVKTNSRTCTKSEDGVGFSYCPEGTAHVSLGKGNVMTCSDKMCKWNCVGMQGAALALFMQPVYVDSITIGRKFCETHARRALCCRVSKFASTSACDHVVYQSKHPVLMTSNIKFDTGSVVAEEGAKFTETRCFAAWRTANSICVGISADSADPAVYVKEVLNGSTGLLEAGDVSALSSNRQLQLTRDIIASIHSRSGDHVLAARLHDVSISGGLRELKRQARGYQEAKRKLTSPPFPLADWICK
ncbi:hypothetical protein EON65_34770 [archaeon]|nr:MAG: hypothetical protein EON65_34770 [archaeon]